jgi:hypothetical protein
MFRLSGNEEIVITSVEALSTANHLNSGNI